jgi:hypothetical protein
MLSAAAAAKIRSGFSSSVVEIGRVAQLVEQRIENPRVGSSILPPATSIQKGLVID